jgi:DNA-binding GntR family transcriptional regulator
VCAARRIAFSGVEALGRLAAESFVEVLPQRGTRVAQIDLADCRQSMFIRRSLEVAAMEFLARASTPRF